MRYSCPHLWPGNPTSEEISLKFRARIGCRLWDQTQRQKFESLFSSLTGKSIVFFLIFLLDWNDHLFFYLFFCFVFLYRPSPKAGSGLHRQFMISSVHCKLDNILYMLFLCHREKTRYPFWRRQKTCSPSPQKAAASNSAFQLNKNALWLSLVSDSKFCFLRKNQKAEQWSSLVPVLHQTWRHWRKLQDHNPEGAIIAT